jgi:hypothetical protein
VIRDLKPLALFLIIFASASVVFYDSVQYCMFEYVNSEFQFSLNIV